jgi:glycolate oxidase
MHVTNKDAVLKELASIVGPKNATASKHIRYAYSYDMSFVQPKLPDYVVLVSTVEEVQGILRYANREKIPVVPYTAGTNIGGLTIPERGGILMDLKRMNKIITIDTESHYAVIEPGVSHAQLATALYPHKLRFGWPVGPPSASVSSCAISHGIGGLNARYGLLINPNRKTRPNGSTSPTPTPLLKRRKRPGRRSGPWWWPRKRKKGPPSK